MAVQNVNKGFVYITDFTASLKPKRRFFQRDPAICILYTLYVHINRHIELVVT